MFGRLVTRFLDSGAHRDVFLHKAQIGNLKVGMEAGKADIPLCARHLRRQRHLEICSFRSRTEWR